MAFLQAANPPEVCTSVDAASTGVDKDSQSSAIWCFLLSVPGVLLLLLLFCHLLVSSNYVTDFTGFLIGAKLLGTKKIYDVAANLALQKALVARTHPGIIFVRMPFWAFAIKPFLLLAYVHALFLWRALLVAVFIVCGIVAEQRRYFFLALCWSIPAAGCLATGNDTPLVLLLMLLSLACWRKKRHFLAGAVLGLCLAKFHFLVFLPLLLLRKKYRQELKGFSLTVAVLIAINFAVQPDWVPLYWNALHLPQKNMYPNAPLMPNFYSAFFWTGHSKLAVIFGAVLVLAFLWPICRRLPFDLAMPLCVLGGVIVAPHTNFLDLALAIPALLSISSQLSRAKPLALFLLSPVAGLLSFFGPPVIGPCILVAASVSLLWLTSLSENHSPIKKA